MSKNSQSNFISASAYAFQDCDPVYLFTNENIYGTLKTAGDISNKKILTVGASGDHAFESYLLGAGCVHTFDINSHQKNVIELKNHMIRGLPYANFMDFFFSRKNFFNQKILMPIKSNFSNDLCRFLKKCSGAHMRRNFKYRAAHTSEYDISKLQYIANESNYDTVRNRLPEHIPFKHCDISTVRIAMQDNVQKYGPHYLEHVNIPFEQSGPDMYADFTERYDLILLSNIFGYLYADSRDAEERLDRTKRNILVPLIANNLNEDGRVYFHYLWDAKTSQWSNFLNYFQRKHNSQIEFVARTIDGAFHEYKCDAVLYATQRQR